ncbi:MAG: glycoside hydrolase family 43 protein [Acidobacteriota bacterium]
MKRNNKKISSFLIVGYMILYLVGCGGANSGGEVAEGNDVVIPRTLSKAIEYNGINGYARNPIVSHIFTADPSAKVFDGRVYVYASHDLDDQKNYNMVDYHVFSSNDLVNWQDHGMAFSIEDAPWAEKLYAPDAVYSPATRKYYLYFPNSGNSIGVALSDTPYGPFKDAIGKALIDRDIPGVEEVDWVFDPTCFIDDDGQVYLYFGGGMPGTGDNARVIRLNEDMISLKDAEATTILAPDYFEAPFVHKKDGLYYFSYSTTFQDHSAYIDYMTSENPMTGWKYRGTILKNPEHNRNNNNHHSIVEFEGGWYLFYHNRVISDREGLTEYQRCITLDHLTYDESGAIKEVSTTPGQVKQLRNLDAFARLEAETMADQRGIEVDFVKADGKNAGVMVTDIHNEDWIGYSQVDFRDGASVFKARVASVAPNNAAIDVYIDGSDMFRNLPGKRIGTCLVKPTGGWQNWRDISCNIEETTGVHDLYLRFAGNSTEPLLNLDYFSFN